MRISDTKMNLSLFGAGATVMGTEGVSNNATGEKSNYAYGTGLTEEMKTYYSDYLIDNAEPALVYDKFAQKVNIPRGNGKTIQFRKYNPLPTLTTSIVEGVTPTGQKIDMNTVNATVAQYGGYVEFSDFLLMSAIDNNLCMATKLLGAQAGRTLDAITREVVCGGTNVQYADGQVSARHLLSGNNENPEDNCYLTVSAIKRAVRFLKNQNAEKIDGSYIAIIHPDCAYDLMNDPNWKFPHQYATPENIYEGEIGKIEGVRFIESTEAKVFNSKPIVPGGIMTVALDVVDSSAVNFTCTVPVETNALMGKEITIGGKKCIISANTTSTLMLQNAADGTLANVTCYAGDVIGAGDCGANGEDVYATLVFGDNAYGTTSIEGGGLEHIVKQLGSSGADDPLNQRATVGWKASKVSVRLCEAFMVRIETVASAYYDN